LGQGDPEETHPERPDRGTGVSPLNRPVDALSTLRPSMTSWPVTGLEIEMLGG